MIAAAFHRWERKLASADTNRVVRPFEWGLDWVGLDARQVDSTPEQALARWGEAALADSDRFFHAPPTKDYRWLDDGPVALDGERTVVFPSAIETPHGENNRVHLRYFPGRRRGRARRE